MAGPTEYQWVITSTNYDSDPKFPRWLRFDGIDDYLNLPYMGLYANGSASVVASILCNQKTSTQYILCESTAAVSASRYTPMLIQKNSTKYSALIRTNDGVELINETQISTQITQSVTILSTIDAGPSIKMIRNSKNEVSSNYSRTAALVVDKTVIGAFGQGAGLLFLMGNIYGLIITKSAITDAQRVKCERFLAKKSGVML